MYPLLSYHFSILSYSIYLILRLVLLVHFTSPLVFSLVSDEEWNNLLFSFYYLQNSTSPWSWPQSDKTAVAADKTAMFRKRRVIGLRAENCPVPSVTPLQSPFLLGVTAALIIAICDDPCWFLMIWFTGHMCSVSLSTSPVHKVFVV